MSSEPVSSDTPGSTLPASPDVGTQPGAGKQAQLYNVAVEITIWRFLAAPVFLLIYQWPHLVGKIIALLVLSAAMLTDYFDGWIARRRGIVSDMGKVLDPLADVVLFQTVFIGFMLCTPTDPTTGATWIPWWIVAIMLGRETFMHGFVRPYVRRLGFQLPARRSGKAKVICASSVAPLIVVLDGAWLAGWQASWLPQVAWWSMALVAAFSVFSLIEYFVVIARLRRQLRAPVASDETPAAA